MRLESDTPLFTQVQLDWLALRGVVLPQAISMTNEQRRWFADHNIDPDTVVAVSTEDIDAPHLAPHHTKLVEQGKREDVEYTMVTVLELLATGDGQRRKRFPVPNKSAFPTGS